MKCRVPEGILSPISVPPCPPPAPCEVVGKQGNAGAPAKPLCRSHQRCLLPHAPATLDSKRATGKKAKQQLDFKLTQTSHDDALQTGRR